MKLHVLLVVAVLLGESKAVDTSTDDSVVPGLKRSTLPILMRAGEEYFIRLDSPSRRVNELLRAPGLRPRDPTDTMPERQYRSDDAPTSLDLTFHLLREVLQMARAERLAQQVSSNRRMMDQFGK